MARGNQPSPANTHDRPQQARNKNSQDIDHRSRLRRLPSTQADFPGRSVTETSMMFMMPIADQQRDGCDAPQEDGQDADDRRGRVGQVLLVENGKIFPPRLPRGAHAHDVGNLRAASVTDAALWLGCKIPRVHIVSGGLHQRGQGRW